MIRSPKARWELDQDQDPNSLNELTGVTIAIGKSTVNPRSWQ